MTLGVLMIEQAKKLVENLMKNDDSGHGMEHIERVFDLAMQFAENEHCDKEIVALGALLHDVDDYKLFGEQNQQQLTNTNIILDKLAVDDDTKYRVLEIVSNIGYSKRLKGKCPSSIEGMIVSDADMCDCLGANGILRTHQYELKHSKPFFDKNIWPIEDINANNYTKKVSDTAVCHMFEKILRIKNLMLTKSGRKEAIERHEFVVNFLKQVFREEKCYDWINYLDEFLQDSDNINNI